MISLDNLKTILYAIKCILTDYPKKRDIPTKLPNPSPLTFTGAVSGSYDGSEPLTIEIPSGGNGSGGVQHDWNQNDATQPDYIKNRPFYTGDLVDTVLVEERTVSFADHGNIYTTELAAEFIPTVGETYTVYWDSAAYECICVVSEGMLCLGNLSIPGIGSDTGEPFLMLSNGQAIAFYTKDTAASHTISISGLATEVVKLDVKYLPFPFKPNGESYLTFSSRDSFILTASGKTWDGTLEYFSSDKTWTVWDGTNSLSSIYNGTGYTMYLRGIGNTVITTYNSGWKLNGSDISCIGNIEILLDYTTVQSGGHPTMGEGCYYHMFAYCDSLTQAPELPATTLVKSCYADMFRCCYSLTKAPELPATTLADDCYRWMFYGCKSLKHAPALPATTLAPYCYNEMFYGCKSLKHAPALPATTLQNSCYEDMFYGCANLTQVPKLLLATTLADSCCKGMFQGCTSLTHAPALPATTLAEDCYYKMFKDCTSLIQIPELPAITLPYNCYDCMFEGCASLKFSETKTEEYTQEYRIPSSGEGIEPGYSLTNIFYGTGGTFINTPKINTTYYLSSDNMIVRGNENTNLNGYVKSMIDAAGYLTLETINAAGYLTLETLPKYEGVFE